MALERERGVEEFLNTVCAGVRFQDAHQEIRREILSHIEEKVEELTARGLDERDAVKQALAQMGDASDLGKRLNEVHKPRTEWGLVLLVGALVGFGLIALYTIEANGLLEYATVFSGIFYKSLVYAGLGIAVAFALSLFDYRKLAPLSKYLFAATVIVVGLVCLSGPNTGGYRLDLGFVMVDVVSIAPYFLLAALAGIFAHPDWDWLQKGDSPLFYPILKTFVLLAVPLVLFVSVPSMASVVMFSVGFLILMFASGARWPQMAAVAVVPLLAAGVAVISHPWHVPRLFGFLQPDRDAQGAGYLYLQISEAVRAAGWWGQGFAPGTGFLPEIHTDLIFTYIVYSFGWLAGLLLVLLAAALVFRMIRVARCIKDGYGRLLVISMVSLLFVQFLWNILMCVGLAPLSGIGLPFVSFGGSMLVVNMLALGLVISVYRRKNREVISEWPAKKGTVPFL